MRRAFRYYCSVSWGINWFWGLFREEVAKWVIRGGLALLATGALLLLPDVRAFLAQLLSIPVWLLLGLLVAASAVPWLVGAIRRRRAGSREFEPMDILTPDLPIPLLWRLKQPAQDWVNHPVGATLDSYLSHVLDGPFCGTPQGKGKYCRHQLSEPPTRPSHRGYYWFPWRCALCDSGKDSAGYIGKTSTVDDCKRSVILAMQRYVHNRGQISDKIELHW